MNLSSLKLALSERYQALGASDRRALLVLGSFFVLLAPWELQGPPGRAKGGQGSLQAPKKHQEYCFCIYFCRNL